MNRLTRFLFGDSNQEQPEQGEIKSHYHAERDQQMLIQWVNNRWVVLREFPSNPHKYQIYEILVSGKNISYHYDGQYWRECKW